MKTDFKELISSGECFGITINDKDNKTKGALNFVAHYGLLEKNNFYWTTPFWREPDTEKTSHNMKLTKKLKDYPPIDEDDFDRFYFETEVHEVILSKIYIGHYGEKETVFFIDLVNKSTADYSYDAFVSLMRKEFD